MVTTPALPVEKLVATELKGVGVVETESGVAVCEFESSVVDGAAEGRCADVCDAEFPPPEPLPLSARPVILAMLGTVVAVLPPIVAYAFPSCSAKKGRGDGDSLQQLTCWASALQHHWLS
jgi:hypothetical protein